MIFHCSGRRPRRPYLPFRMCHEKDPRQRGELCHETHPCPASYRTAYVSPSSCRLPSGAPSGTDAPAQESAGEPVRSQLTGKSLSDQTECSLLEALAERNIGVDRQTDGTASFSYKERTYVIDFDRATITEEGSDDNWLLAPPGSEQAVIRGTGTDILLDPVTLTGLFQLLDMRR